MIDIIVVIIVISMIVFIMSSLTSGVVKKKEHCKLHTWAFYEDTPGMYCKECGYVAGTYISENGEY